MTADTAKHRDPRIDIIKGIAILLVLIGHVIQYASGAEYQRVGAFYDNVLFKFIYGFHMPLFMVVSGYLFYRTVCHKSPKDVIVSRLKTLIVPIFAFSLIEWIFRFNPQYSFFDQIRNYLSVTRYTLWFLWALFYSSMGVLVGHYLFKDNVLIWLVLILASFMTPDKWFSECYKYTFPCFLFGYYVNKHDWTLQLKKNLKLIASVCGFLYIGCLFFYDTDCFVYMSGCDILSGGGIDFRQLGVDIFRIIVGILGSVFVISLVLLLYHPANEGLPMGFLARIGMDTMGIYCFQYYFFYLFAPRISSGMVPMDSWGGVLANRLLCLILVFTISFGLTWAVKRIKVLDVLFLGGR